MASGPGKYDVLATYVREQAQAEAVVVIVLGGNQGSGFSVQATELWIEKDEPALPALLRLVAEQIEVETR